MPQSKVAVVHPGTQHSWQTARALQDLGRLAFYGTSIRYDPARWPYRLERAPLVGPALHREFTRFHIPGIEPGLVRTYGWHEWVERMATRAGLPALAQWIDGHGNITFGKWAARETRKTGSGALWAYDNSALSAFQQLDGSGIKRILDVTIAPRRALNRIMQEIEADWPDFVSGSRRSVPEHILARAENEIALADAICVGSPFVRDTILAETGEPAIAARIHQLPYCFDEALFAAPPAPLLRPEPEPVRMVFVGGIGPRKGAHLLLEAIRRIPPSEVALTLVGSLDMPEATFARYRDRVTHIAHVARSEMPAIMARNDALILPSYFEGSSIALLEGLASGLALIQSRNAGLGVTPETGILLDALSVAEVERAIRELASDRNRLLAWRRAALVRAQEFTFVRYRDNIAALLAGLGI